MTVGSVGAKLLQQLPRCRAMDGSRSAILAATLRRSFLRKETFCNCCYRPRPFPQSSWVSSKRVFVQGGARERLFLPNTNGRGETSLPRALNMRSGIPKLLHGLLPNEIYVVKGKLGLSRFGCTGTFLSFSFAGVQACQRGRVSECLTFANTLLTTREDVCRRIENKLFS